MSYMTAMLYSFLHAGVLLPRACCPGFSFRVPAAYGTDCVSAAPAGLHARAGPP